MKAWRVGPYDGEWSAVVFAETRAKARMKCEAEYGDGISSGNEWLYWQAVRLPAADGLTDNDITARWLLEHGWWLECVVCGDTLNQAEGATFSDRNSWAVYCEECE